MGIPGNTGATGARGTQGKPGIPGNNVVFVPVGRTAC